MYKHMYDSQTDRRSRNVTYLHVHVRALLPVVRAERKKKTTWTYIRRKEEAYSASYNGTDVL